MTSGKVVHFDTQRGFGFLAPDAGGEDVFLHVNDIDFDEAALRPGTAVTFEVENGDKGLKAINVAVVGGAPAAAPRRDHRDNRGDRDHRGDRGDRGDRRDQREQRPPRRDAPARPAAGAGAVGMQSFLDDVTELLLDSSDDLTAGQIIAVRQRFADFAYQHGWVSE